MVETPKMDGLYGKPLLKWDDLGVPPLKEASTSLKETTLEGGKHHSLKLKEST